MHRIKPRILCNSRNLRQNLTPAERILWRWLRNRQIDGLKFRRQFPIGNYITDFCCIEKKLVVEIDGGSHLEQEEYDKMRTEWLEEQGFHVIRFSNEMIYKQLDSVIDVIRVHCNSSPSQGEVR
jgi:very-short-patch-repair endonuclease